jgi:hypothetical protein
MKLRQKLKSYQQNEGGHFAVMTAILAVPLLVVTSAAVDYTSAIGEHRKVKDALNNAVIAAATNNAVSIAEKENIARLHFEQNYTGRADVTLEPDAQTSYVAMKAVGEVPVTISEALGVSGIPIEARSKAQINSENVICVLGLDPTGEDAVSFTSELKFKAPTCTVHSNSTSATSILSDGRHAPIAKSFCAVGGVSGSFSPYAKGECLPIADPYKTTAAAPIGSCMPDSVYKTVGKPMDKRVIWGHIVRATVAYLRAKKTGKASKWAYDLFPDSGNTTGSNAVLYPGTYCNGLTVDGEKVVFMPGDYIIKDGPLTFKNFAEARAENVTFGFTGTASTLRIEKGADVYVKAPSVGTRKGLAFMEMPGAGGDQNKPGFLPSMITSGGQLTVLGTLYFPTQKLIVSGSGTKLGAEADSTSFIAYNVIFEGESGSEVLVQVNHRSAGLPPVEPRAEDGVTLVE